MADEQKPTNSGSSSSSSGGNKEKTGKRRYFRRRRNKPKKQEGQAEQTQPESAPTKGTQRSTGATAERKGPTGKKRRSRRKRNSRRSTGQAETSTQMIQEPEQKYEEPTSVYVYTHVVRPAYRDMLPDYRPESSFFSGESHETAPEAASLLSSDIFEQLDRYFTEEETGSRPKRVIEYNEADWDDDEDESTEDGAVEGGPSGAA